MDQNQGQNQDQQGPTVEPGIRELISDLSGRLPQYGRLSARLVSEGRMSSQQTGPLSGVMRGGLPLARLTRAIPIVGQLSQILVTVSAIQYALQQMQPEAAQRHLDAVGLTRQQVEADYANIKRVSSSLGQQSGQRAGEMADTGVRMAGHYAGKGWKAFRGWRDKLRE